MPVILDNPIINAYIQGIQMKRQKDETEFNQQQKKEEGARAQEQLKGYLSHLDAEHKHSAAQLELQKQQVELQKQSHTFEATKYLAGLQNTGQYQPGKGPAPINVQDTSTVIHGQQEFPNFEDSGNPSYPHLPENQMRVEQGITAQPGIASKAIEIAPGVSFNPDDLTGPQAQLQQEIARNRALGDQQAITAGKIVGEQQKAEEPFDITKSERATTAATALDIQKAKEAKELATQRDNAAMDRMKLQGNDRKIAAKLLADARVLAAKAKGTADPEAIMNNALLHASGQGGPELANNPDGTATKLVMTKNNLVSFPAKDATRLRDVHGLDTLYTEMDNFIGQLPTSGVNAVGQKIIAKIPATQLNNFRDKVIAMSGNIAKTVGGESGRLSEDDIKRAIGILVTPGMTQEIARDKLRFLSDTTRSKVVDQILGGQGDHQKLWLLQKFDFDPTKFNSEIKVGKDAFDKFQKNPQTGEWGVFNKKTLHYEPIGIGGK